MTSWTYFLTKESELPKESGPATARTVAVEPVEEIESIEEVGYRYRRARSKRVRGGVGAALTIGVHVAVIALLLANRTTVETEPAPINVAIISDAPQQQHEQQLEVTEKPKLDQPKLHIPQPDIALANDAAAQAPVAVSAAAPSQRAEPAQPAQTQPIFDADYLNNPAPSYPPLARRMKEQGVVYVRVHVSSEGLPDQIELKRSSGSMRLDEAALVTVKKWRFVPARRGGEAVSAWVVVPIAFSLTA